MSLIKQEPKKVNKTDDFTAYHKDWRDKNITHIRNKGKCTYYKRKYDLDDEFIKQYGEYSGQVFKIIKELKDVIDKCPELAEPIIEHLKTID